MEKKLEVEPFVLYWVCCLDSNLNNSLFSKLLGDVLFMKKNWIQWNKTLCDPNETQEYILKTHNFIYSRDRRIWELFSRSISNEYFPGLLLTPVE